MVPFDGSTKLSKVLKAYPQLLDYIITLNPHDFARLRNPLMRKVMPQRITLARLAEMTQTPIGDLLHSIYEQAGIPLPKDDLARLRAESERSAAALSQNPTAPPDWLADGATAVVDILESDDRLDTDPFVPFFPVLNRLEPGQIVLLKHRWEPQPLYDVMQKLNVPYYALQKAPDEWWIYFRKGEKVSRKQA